jgi:hypothetical protein
MNGQAAHARTEVPLACRWSALSAVQQERQRLVDGAFDRHPVAFYRAGERRDFGKPRRTDLADVQLLWEQRARQGPFVDVDASSEAGQFRGLFLVEGDVESMRCHAKDATRNDATRVSPVEGVRVLPCRRSMCAAACTVRRVGAGHGHDRPTARTAVRGSLTG